MKMIKQDGTLSGKNILVSSAALVIILAGIYLAQSVVVLFLLAAFLALL